MEIKLEHYLINELNDGAKIYIVPMSKRVYEEFSQDYASLSDLSSMNRFADKYGFTYRQVILDGNTYIDVNDPEEVDGVRPILARILPKPKIVENPLTEKREPAYKCFCCDSLNIENVLEHKTPVSSWQCLMLKLGEPEYAIVLEIKPKK